MSKAFFLTLVSLVFSIQSFAVTQDGKYFNRVITVIFENKNYSDVMRQPFFSELARTGANFSNILALTHPSQPNYIALTSGSMYNVTSNSVVTLNVRNIIDLLEAKGISWRVYAEGYPGNCYLGATRGNYARKHNPFISYVNIQNNPVRCANIVSAVQFDQDAANGTLPSYVFYIPDNKNSGHDTSVGYADRWYGEKFRKYVGDNRFMQDTVVISTFDESEPQASRNQIYTSIVGPSVKAGSYSTPLTLYSLLHLIEDNWNLGNLGKEDVTAPPIPNIWQ